MTEPTIEQGSAGTVFITPAPGAAVDRATLRRESLVVGVGALALFTLGFGHQPFVGFETRFALFAQEMWRHGITLFPTAYGEPYPDYPVTSTILIYAMSLLLGGVTKLSAILPTAIFSALNLMLLYRLLAPLSRRWGALAVGFALLTATFLSEARSISLDQMLATVTLGAFYVAYRGEADSGPRRWWWLAGLLGLGFSIRGPLGVVIPAAVVGSLYLLSQQWRKLLVLGALSTAVLILCWGSLLAVAHGIYGSEFVGDVIRMQVTGRLGESAETGRAYYFSSSFGNYALAYPVAFVVAMVVAVAGRTFLSAREDQHRLAVYFIGWAVVVLAGLSLADTRKIRYLLPMVPAIAALAAYPLAYDTFPRGERALRWLRFAVEKLLLLLPLLAGIALISMQHGSRHRELLDHLPLVPVYLLLAICQIAVLALPFIRRDVEKTPVIVGCAVFVVWTVNLLLVEPSVGRAHDTQVFVDRVEAARKAQPARLVFFRIGKDAAAIKYLVGLDYDLRPRFASAARELDGIVAPFYVIVPEEYQAEFLSAQRVAGLEPLVRERFDNRSYLAYFVPR